MMPYTFLNDEDLNLIANQFAIFDVESYEVLSGGSENTNYLLTTDRAKYVLTICEQKSIKETFRLALLLEHLADNNFTTSKIIRSINNEPVIIWKEKPVILKKYIEGHIVPNLPLHLISYAAKELGKLHKISPPDYLPDDINYGATYFHEVELYAPESPFYSWLKGIKERTLKYMDSDLPKCLIHSDVFYNNIIVSTDNASAQIMDFEEASFYYRIFDLGMMIIGTCDNDDMIDMKKVNYLLKGYQQEIELTEIEKKVLQPFTVYAAASMSFWRHKNFNYTNPTTGMENHYLALKNIADFVSEIPQDRFRNALR